MMKALAPDTEFTGPEILDAFQRDGIWACYCPPSRLNAVRVKISRVARKRGVEFRGVWEQDKDRFSMIAPIFGRCPPEPKPNTYEAANLQAIADLRRTIRQLRAKLESEVRCADS